MTGPVASSPPGPVGQGLPRLEDDALLRGRGRFVDDLDVPGALHARFIRSPVAHGRITTISTAAARSLPGVVGVFTGAEVGANPILAPLATPGVVPLPRPVLPGDTVRFSGEAVAVVVADSPYVAEDAAELVELEVGELPVLVDPELAADSEALPIHPLPGNVILDRRHDLGDVDAAFADAPIVFERTFRAARCSAAPMEPRSVLALPEAEAVRIHASVQIPHRMRDVVAESLGLEPTQVRVTSADIGGSFGQKGHIYPEDVVVAWLARHLDRPVVFVEDRLENLVASAHARDQRIHVRAAADRDGRVLAIDADVLSDIGAYGTDAHGPLVEAGGTPSMIPGPYRLPAYRFRSRAVCTNKAPQGAYRGVGLPMAVFTHERIMDILAVELGCEPAEVRRRNMITSAEMPFETATGRLYDNGDFPRALATALDLADHAGFRVEQRAAAAQGRLLGLGIASFVEYTGMNATEYSKRGMLATRGVDSVRLRLESDGRATLWSTMPTVGQGMITTFSQLAAAGLGIPVTALTVLPTDTAASALAGQGTGASRGMVVGGNAVYEVACALRRRLNSDAAALLDTTPERVLLQDGVLAVADAPSQGIPLSAVVDTASPGGYEASTTYESPSVCYSYATHVCRVEVDPENGAVRVDRYVVSDDCGRVINPLVVEGQVRGAITQGIGVALYEQHHYDANGQLQTASLMDYLLPTATDAPPVEISSFELPAPSSTLGTKGVGESGTLGPPAALANAVSDALGVEINELPITPARVRAILRTRVASERIAS